MHELMNPIAIETAPFQSQTIFSCQNEFFLHIVSCWRDGKNMQKWQWFLPFNFRLWHLEPVVPPARGCRSQRPHEKKVETVHWLTDWTYYNSPNCLCKSANAHKLVVWKITAKTTASFNLQTCFQKKNNTTLLLYKAASLELALATAWKSGNHSSLHASRIGGGIDLEEWIHSQDSPKEGWNCKVSWWINSAMYVALPGLKCMSTNFFTNGPSFPDNTHC